MTKIKNAYCSSKFRESSSPIGDIARSYVKYPQNLSLAKVANMATLCVSLVDHLRNPMANISKSLEAYFSSHHFWEIGDVFGYETSWNPFLFYMLSKKEIFAHKIWLQSHNNENLLPCICVARSGHIMWSNCLLFPFCAASALDRMISLCALAVWEQRFVHSGPISSTIFEQALHQCSEPGFMYDGNIIKGLMHC